MPRLPPVTRDKIRKDLDGYIICRKVSLEACCSEHQHREHGSPKATGFAGISFFFLAIIAKSRLISRPVGAKAEARGRTSMRRDPSCMLSSSS